MSILINARGTSEERFKINKSGPTIFQGSTTPDLATLVDTPATGDLYMQHGATPGLYLYKTDQWIAVITAGGSTYDYDGTLSLGNSSAAYASSNDYLFYTNTTDATQKEMFINAGTMSRIDVPSDSTVSFHAHVTARSNNDLSCGYIIKGLVNNNSGTLAFVNPLVEEILGETTDSWFATVELNQPSQAISIKVQGQLAEQINWVARVTTVLAK